MSGSILKSFPALGTLNTLKIYDAPKTQSADAIKTYTLRLEETLSVFRPDSEISRINRHAGHMYQPVSEDTFRMIRDGIRYSRITDGAFDLTAGPLSKLWKNSLSGGHCPSPWAIRRQKRLVDYQDILLKTTAAEPKGPESDLSLPEQYYVGLAGCGQSLDPGGIAKGYASDRIREMLIRDGVKNAILDLGGTVTVLGSPHIIGIQHPGMAPGCCMGRLTLQDCSIATSGSYEQYRTLGGKRYHHIIDPRTGRPAESGLCSVTLIGGSATMLDALATGVFVLGISASIQILQDLNLQAIFIKNTGEVLITKGLLNQFEPVSDTIPNVVA